MVSGVKTEMPCCYQHKTSNITGLGTETVLKGDRRRSKSNMRLTTAKSKVLGKTERKGESVSVKETVSD